MSENKILTVPAERWQKAHDSLAAVFPAIAQILRKHNFEGQGEQDADEFSEDAMLALVALKYVQENASDKCKFVLTE